jgi:hypothetical protein
VARLLYLYELFYTYPNIQKDGKNKIYGFIPLKKKKLLFQVLKYYKRNETGIEIIEIPFVDFLNAYIEVIRNDFTYPGLKRVGTLPLHFDYTAEENVAEHDSFVASIGIQAIRRGGTKKRNKRFRKSRKSRKSPLPVF